MFLRCPLSSNSSVAGSILLLLLPRPLSSSLRLLLMLLRGFAEGEAPPKGLLVKLQRLGEEHVCSDGHLIVACESTSIMPSLLPSHSEPTAPSSASLERSMLASKTTENKKNTHRRGRNGGPGVGEESCPFLPSLWTHFEHNPWIPCECSSVHIVDYASQLWSVQNNLSNLFFCNIFGTKTK